MPTKLLFLFQVGGAGRKYFLQANYLKPTNHICSFRWACPVVGKTNQLSSGGRHQAVFRGWLERDHWYLQPIAASPGNHVVYQVPGTCSHLRANWGLGLGGWVDIFTFQGLFESLFLWQETQRISKGPKKQKNKKQNKTKGNPNQNKSESLKLHFFSMRNLNIQIDKNKSAISTRSKESYSEHY